MPECARDDEASARDRVHSRSCRYGSSLLATTRAGNGSVISGTARNKAASTLGNDDPSGSGTATRNPP
jgi:hypothetical protein